MNHRTSAAVCLLAASATSLLGLGVRIADQDPRATARGNAFAATADNPSAIYYNPAGITQLEGQHASFSLYAIQLNSHYTSPAGSTADTADEIQAIPHLYYTLSPKDSPVSYGVGLYSPYGLGLKWPQNTGFRTIAVEGRISYLTLNPIVAWQVHPTLSLAAGPTLNYSQTTIKRGIGLPGDEFKFKGDDIDVGFTAGLLWQPHPKHSFGVSYRSATTMDYSGHSTVTPYPRPKETADARFSFPQNVVVGYSFRPTPAWNFEFDVDWTDWNRLNTVTLNQAVSGPVLLPFNWQNSLFYEWGVTRTFGNGYSVSGGYIYSENTVPEKSFTPVVPDSDRHIFSLGVGKKYSSWSWDAAYQLAYGPTRSVTGTAPSPNPFIPGLSESADGHYRFISHALTVSIGFNY